MTNEQKTAINQLARAVLGVVKDAGPLGAPAGPMYAAFMHHGVSLAQFEAFMAALVRTGKITKHGDCYHLA